FLFTCCRPYPYLHSFPTRRSSDLDQRAEEFVLCRRGGLAAHFDDDADVGGVVDEDADASFGRLVGFALDAGLGVPGAEQGDGLRSEEHTSELQSRVDLVCRLLLEK